MVHVLALALLAFVALYPVVTAGIWIVGGLLFRLLDEHNDCAPRSRAGRRSAS